MTNPFSPPDAPVADPAAPPVRAFGSAPISVYLLLLVAALVALSCLVSVCADVVALLSHGGLHPPYADVQPPALKFVVGDLVWHLVALVVLVPVLPGIYRHHPWARWLGLLAIAGFALNFALDPWIAAKGGTAAPGVGRAAFFVALCVGWGWAYGFSAKGRAWFDPRPALPESA